MPECVCPSHMFFKALPRLNTPKTNRCGNENNGCQTGFVDDGNDNKVL